jgi:3,4-dihydroxy 2-butanone 4-phosphate synthase/GTP cyclohydrolase II
MSSEALLSDFRRPGNVFPVCYIQGGVLTHLRPGEAGVDLARLAGLMEAAVFGEIANDDGSVANVEQVQKVAKREQLTVISLSDLVEFRWNHEQLVKPVSQARMPTDFGEFKMVLYGSLVDDFEHIALVKGEFAEGDEVLVRVHSECMTGEIFSSRRCDCGIQLHTAMQKISDEGKGVVIYLRGHEGRGIGLAHKLKAYCLQDQGQDTVEANIALGFPVDKRDYGIGAQILRDLGVKKVKLLTNNPKKSSALQAYGFDIVSRVPLVCEFHEDNIHYLRTKKIKLGHMIEI